MRTTALRVLSDTRCHDEDIGHAIHSRGSAGDISSVHIFFKYCVCSCAR